MTITKYLLIGSLISICILYAIQFFLKKTHSTKNPKYLYKILTKVEWDDIKSKSVMKGSAMDIKDGFIHLSTAQQTQRIANKYFPNMSDGYLLKIQYKNIQSKTKWEANSQGELFAHCYDEIPIELISDIYNLSVNEFKFDQLAY